MIRESLFSIFVLGVNSLSNAERIVRHDQEFSWRQAILWARFSVGDGYYGRFSFLVLAGVFVLRFLRIGRIEMLRMMNMPQQAEHKMDHKEYEGHEGWERHEGHGSHHMGQH